MTEQSSTRNITWSTARPARPDPEQPDLDRCGDDDRGDPSGAGGACGVAAAPALRPRTLVASVFADALDGDQAAGAALRDLAVLEHPYAEAAFWALSLLTLHELERRPAGPRDDLPLHQLDQLLAALHDPRRQR